MVLQCAEHFYYKVSGEFLQQDSQSSYSFGKIQNVGEAELFEEKKFIVSLEKDFILYIYYQSGNFDTLKHVSNESKM